MLFSLLLMLVALVLTAWGGSICWKILRGGSSALAPRQGVAGALALVSGLVLGFVALLLAALFGLLGSGIVEWLRGLTHGQTW